MNTEEFMNKVSEAGRALDIREKDILDTLNYVSSKKSVDPKVLLRKFGLPEVHFKRLLKLFSEILMPPPGPVTLKENGPIHGGLKDNPPRFGLLEVELIKKILRNYKSLRPKPDRSFDQFTATIATTARRAVEMAKRGDLYHRNIAFLGDDDLTSVAVALTKQAQRITVFEIDQRIMALIRKIAFENKLDIELVKQDLRQSLPNINLAAFDTVFTDPPYTTSGISLFLNRGIELLKKKFVSRIYLCYGNSDRARERELEIQKLFSEKGLLINSKRFQFNKYHGAESIGSSSSLYLLDWTPKTKTTKVDIDRLYTNE